jgi:hypothetical protein
MSLTREEGWVYLLCKIYILCQNTHSSSRAIQSNQFNSRIRNNYTLTTFTTFSRIAKFE